MEFVRISDLRTCPEVKKLYHESFPVEEQVEFEKLFSGIFENYSLYSLCENGELIAMVHFKELKNFVHVNYLAVKQEHQNKGYGSAVLDFVKQNCVKKPLVLDIEELDEDAINFEDRKRRVRFYKKNAFKEGKYKFSWQGVLMTYMNTGEIDAEEFMTYIQIVFPTIKNVELKCESLL